MPSSSPLHIYMAIEELLEIGMEGRGGLLPFLVRQCPARSADIVGRRVLRNAPDSDMDVYGAPLLVLQPYDIVEYPLKPLRVLVSQHCFNSVTNHLVHVDSCEAS